MGMDEIKALQADKAKEKRAAKRERKLRPKATVDVMALPLEALQYALTWAIANGGAIRIGTTRDGGAWAFGLYYDGGSQGTEYVQAGEELSEYLIEVGDFFRERMG